jgi:hypothetical protein
MPEPFIGARVRISCDARISNGHFGVVLNTIQFNKAIVRVDDLGEMPYDFGDLECVFDKFDRVQAFGPNCESHGRGQVLRQIPADAGTYVGWFEVQLDREPVGSTRNYRYDDLRFIEACPHVDDFRVGDHVEILPSDPCYSGKRGVVRAFRSGQVEVDFGDEKGTYAQARDLMKVVNTVQSQERILEQIANGVISKKTACDILGVPEEVVDTFTRGLSGLLPRGPKQEKPMNPNRNKDIFRVDVANVKKRITIGRAYGMSEKLADRTIKEIYNGADPKKRETGTPMGVSKTTVSATIVLASGREVRIPDPNPEEWECTEARKLGPASRVRYREKDWQNPNPRLVISRCSLAGEQETKVVDHPEGLCWLKDMGRIVNETEKPDHFTTKYAYVTELRFFQERVVEAEFDSDRPYPTLRAYLW